MPQWRGVVATLEVASAIAAVAAVLGGITAKVNHKWLLHRHVAERLRMLKFEALGRPEFWCAELDQWSAWLRHRCTEVLGVASIQEVADWARSGAAEPLEPPVPAHRLPEAEMRVATIYYRVKRVLYQAAYFDRQRAKSAQESHWLHRLAFPMFVATMIAVIGHFAADYVAHHQDSDDAREAWHAVGVWAMAAAALFPVIGLGVRAWLGAFERVRIASLFEAKNRALLATAGTMRTDAGDCATTMHHVAHVEHFLENEHREWLRLLLDAEWFL
jgi:hypothetical protein